MDHSSACGVTRDPVAVPDYQDRTDGGTHSRKRFVGSKAGAGVWQQIISQMPPHDVYIEPFLGTGIILLNKRPSASTIAGDVDPAACEAFSSSIAGNSLHTGVKVICGDALALLAAYDFGGRELVYLDPPYLGSVRSCKRQYYLFDLAEAEEHTELLTLAKRIPCPVMISGYFSELYADLLRGWRTIQIQTVTRGGPAVEWVWMNFAEPFELHDYRFLGKNFTDRQRLKRKKARWVERLKRMPALERAAVLSAISDCAGVRQRPHHP